MAGEPTITVIGRLGNDPDIHFTQTGRAVANFSVACTPVTKDNDEWVEKDTMWYRVSLWKNSEEFIETVSKGSLVVVTGKLGQRTYETKDGETRTDATIDADVVGVVPTKKKKQEDAPW